LKQVPKHEPFPAPAGIVIAALRGGAGKTIFSVGLIAALRNLGKSVAPFKKGPDYIDAGWLALAAGRPCYNLDTFLIDSDQILRSFRAHSRHVDLVLIEGNRGLYDCINTDGKTSTAELAKLLGLPVILCIDGTKTTRTMAAVVSGCAQFDSKVMIKGVLLNRIAGSRHETILRTSIETHCHIPVLGAVPKLREQAFPERHMGLVPTPEHDWATESIAAIGAVAARYIDLAAIVEVAKSAQAAGDDEGLGVPKSRTLSIRERQPAPLEEVFSSERSTLSQAAAGVPERSDRRPRIGIIRDSAFQFYYPENLEALASGGADIVYTSPLSEDAPPAFEALYIGGGFPETHAAELARNEAYRKAIKALADAGMPVYAECGGLMYLGQELVLEGRAHAMCGVLPIVFGFSKRPQGHGYTIISVRRENPFHAVGSVIKGHEFHYSSVLKWSGEDRDLAFEMRRGSGIVNGLDGICYRNVLATYTHIHALGTPTWAKALVQAARTFRQTRAQNDPQPQP
jgi:cobyrinic acid a,c-diamide synthase